MLQHPQQHIQPFQNMIFFQQFLLLAVVQIDVENHVVEQFVWVILAEYRHNQFSRHSREKVAVLVKRFFQRPNHCSQFNVIDLGTALIRNRLYFCRQKGVLLFHRAELCFLDTFHQYPHDTIRCFQYLAYFCNNTKFVQVFLFRFFYKNIPLCNQKELMIRSIRCIDGLNRSIPCHVKVHDHFREDYNATHGNHRQILGCAFDWIHKVRQSPFFF